jgi:hypothetical protein
VGDTADGLDGVRVGGTALQQDDVRPEQGAQPDRLRPVRSLADHAQVGLGLEEHSKAGTLK